MNEGAFRAVGKWEMVVEEEIDDAEDHHGGHDARARPVDDRVSPSPTRCRRCSNGATMQ
jgi:hypothetical protein